MNIPAPKACIDCGGEPEYLLDVCAPCIDLRIKGECPVQKAPGPAERIVDPSKPIKVSPSQISTYLDCPRKWGWGKIDKIQVPPNGSAALGSKVHAVLEDYLAGKGLVYDPGLAIVGDIASSGLEHIPEPQAPGMIIEHPFTFQPEGLTDVLYTGRIDFFLSPLNTRPRPLIGDHKTTSGLQWAKSPDDLRADPQGVIYGAYAFDAYPEAEGVDLRWVYYQTKGARRSKKTELTWTREENRKALEKINVTAGQIASITRSSIKSATELPYSPEACEKYGGCPYRAQCNLGPGDRRKALFPISRKESNMSAEDIRSRIANRIKESKGSTPPPAEAADSGASVQAYVCPEKAPNGKPVPPNVRKSGMVMVPGTSPAAYTYLENLDVFTRDTYLDAAANAYEKVDGSAVNPPEGQAQPAQEDNAELTAAAKGEDSAYGQAEKPKRTRRTKAQIEADELAAATQGTVDVAPVPVQENATTRVSSVAVTDVASQVENPAEKGYFLFIDSAPLNVPTLAAETLYQETHALLKAEEKIEDYSVPDFGKGVGMFRLAFQEVLGKRIEALPKGKVAYITASSRAREASVAMSELRSKALMTIQGAA